MPCRCRKRRSTPRLQASAVEMRDALALAVQRLEAFHRKQPIGSWMDVTPGGTLGQIVRPLQRVGVYVPAGSAPLPSSLLHAAIPARVAGVAEIVVCTPPDRTTGRVAPLTLAAAHAAGVHAVYCLGGAQAIAAMAYGTETIPRVDKIVGPGGLFVTLAKRQVFGQVGIDGLPGPTETVIIADEFGQPRPGRGRSAGAGRTRCARLGDPADAIAAPGRSWCRSRWLTNWKP